MAAHRGTGCRSYRGAFRPQFPHRDRRHDGATDTVNAPVTESCTCLTNICVTPITRRTTVVIRTGLSSSLVVVRHTNETRKPLRSATSAVGPDGPMSPAEIRRRHLLVIYCRSILGRKLASGRNQPVRHGGQRVTRRAGTQ